MPGRTGLKLPIVIENYDWNVLLEWFGKAFTTRQNLNYRIDNCDLYLTFQVVSWLYQSHNKASKCIENF